MQFFNIGRDKTDPLTILQSFSIDDPIFLNNEKNNYNKINFMQQHVDNIIFVIIL